MKHLHLIITALLLLFCAAFTAQAQASRSALQTAINNAASGGTVTLSQDITFDGTAITINKNITINGNGRKLTQANKDIRHIIVSGTGGNLTLNNVILEGSGTGGGIWQTRSSMTLNNVTIQNCTSTISTGGGLLVGGSDGAGGYYPYSLTLKGDIVIKGNKASQGAGINLQQSNASTVNTSGLTSLLVEGNKATTDSNLGMGGGIKTYHPLNFTAANNVRIIGNESYTGGGVYLCSTSFTMMGGEINNNTATYHAGGIACTGAGAAAIGSVVTLGGGITVSGNKSSHNGGALGGTSVPYTIVISDATFANNIAGYNGTAGRNGGAISFGGELNGVQSGNISVTSSTFSGNEAYQGSAISIGDSPGTTHTITNCTFSENKMFSPTGSTSSNGAVFIENGNMTNNISFSTFYGNDVNAISTTASTSMSNTVTLHGNIIYNNGTGTSSEVRHAPKAASSYNIIGDGNTNAALIAWAATNNNNRIAVNSGNTTAIFGTASPALALNDNLSGYPKTYMIDGAGLAGGKIPSSVGTWATSVTKDQRGKDRPAPAGSNRDIGAVETEGGPVTPPAPAILVANPHLMHRFTVPAPAP